MSSSAVRPSLSRALLAALALAHSGTARAFDAGSNGGGALGGAELEPPMELAKKQSKAKDPGAPVVTFSAFSARPDGGATIRVDLTREARVSMQADGKNDKVVVYRLKDADVRYKNNENPLYAEHFQTVVQRVKLDRGDDGVTVTILLRQKTKSTHRYEARDGVVSLYIDVAAPPAASGS